MNCLYFLLRPGNISPDYEQLSQEMVQQEVAAHIAYWVEAVCGKARVNLPPLGKTNPAGLEKLPMPLIAHFDLVGVGENRAGISS